MKDDPHPISSLGFLLADASRLMRRRFDQKSRDIEMTSAQMRIIARLCRNEGTSQAALAALVEVEPMTLCRHIDRMESAGLVVREQDPHDRRARMLFTTAKARQLIEPLRQRADAIFEEAQAGLSPEARRQLLESLAHIVRNLSESEASDPEAATEATSPRSRHETEEASA